MHALVRRGETLYVGGLFSSIAGSHRNALAAIDIRTRSVRPWNPNPTSRVYALALQRRTLYVCGEFDRLGGRQRAYLGAVDAITGVATPWHPRVETSAHGGSPTLLAVAGSTVFVGGGDEEWTINGHGPLVALDARRGTTMNWQPAHSLLGLTALVASGERLYVAGVFDRIGGVRRAGLAAFNTTTRKIESWAPRTPAGEADAIAVSDTSVYAAVRLRRRGAAYYGQNAPDAIERFDSARGRRMQWHAATTSGPVYALAPSNSTLVVAGAFSGYGWVARKNLAALDIKTGRATSWRPRTDDVRGDEIASVSALVVKGSTVYLGGLFTTVSGIPRSHLAAVDAQSGAVKGWNPRVNKDGAVDAIAVSGDAVYVAGSFKKIGGVPRANLAAVDIRTAKPTSWNPHVSSTPVAYAGDLSEVVALGVAGDTVYIGGQFERVGKKDRQDLAAIESATGHATAWSPHLSSDDAGWVDALAIRKSDVYIGGDFNSVDGQTRHGAAAIDASSGAVQRWDPAPWVPLNAIVVAERTIYVAGAFDSVGGATHHGFAAVDSITGRALPWDPRPMSVGSSEAKAVALSPSAVYVGGVQISPTGASLGAYARPTRKP